jgi:hypothetical protein
LATARGSERAPPTSNRVGCSRRSDCERGHNVVEVRRARAANLRQLVLALLGAHDAPCCRSDAMRALFGVRESAQERLRAKSGLLDA